MTCSREGGSVESAPREYLSVKEAAAEFHTNDSRVLEYASREDDPLPLFHPPWCTRKLLVKRSDMVEWMDRNGVPYGTKG